jgi:hypothetical protein
MRAELNAFRACCLSAVVLVFAGASFAQSKSPVVESRPPAMSQGAPARNYHFHVHLGTSCCFSDGIATDAGNASNASESDITAPYGVVVAHGDANWQPSRFMRFSKAVATAERALQQPSAPAPSLGDVAREQRDSKTSDEKADIRIKQDADGKPVVVTKQP